jgi:hypothetical protein
VVKAEIAIAFITILLLIPGTAHAAGWLDLFARPLADGFRVTECKLVIPDPCVSIVLTEYHPEIDLEFGDWETGMSLRFTTCQTDLWVLVCHLQLLSLSCAWSPDCQVIELGPRDDSGFFGFATCATGYPPEDAEHMYDVYVIFVPCPDGPPPPDRDPPAMYEALSKSFAEVRAYYDERVTEESAGNIENYTACVLSDPEDTLIIADVAMPHEYSASIAASISTVSGAARESYPAR